MQIFVLQPEGGLAAPHRQANKICNGDDKLAAAGAAYGRLHNLHRPAQQRRQTLWTRNFTWLFQGPNPDVKRLTGVLGILLICFGNKEKARHH